MLAECCSQERSYSTFYGLVGERFASWTVFGSIVSKQCFGSTTTWSIVTKRTGWGTLRNSSDICLQTMQFHGMLWVASSSLRKTQHRVAASSLGSCTGKNRNQWVSRFANEEISTRRPKEHPVCYQLLHLNWILTCRYLHGSFAPQI